MRSVESDDRQRDKMRNTIDEIAQRAKLASGVLARLSTEQKNEALLAIAAEIEDAGEKVVAANQQDLSSARLLVESGEMPESLYHRLIVDEPKITNIVSGIRQVAKMEDPIRRVTLTTKLDEDLLLQRVTCPIGVIGVIFEARPDALTQISSLCLKSGNAVLLKGGSEAERSNRVLFDLIQAAAVKQRIPGEAFALLESREDVNAILKAERFIDLIIPRGSNALVRYVQGNTNIPVLGHAEGICHVYVDRTADLDKALQITLDAKVDYPAACNAVETLLVHREVAPAFLPRAVDALKRAGVELRCGSEALQYAKDAKTADESDWQTEYCDLILALRVVNSLEEAINHINHFGSHHTDCIITEDDAAWERFFAEVDSAGVYLNASTRFADGYRYGFGAEVGISTGKLHPRGPVGLEGLVTYKYKLVGKGHTASMYGKGSRSFLHQKTDQRS